MFYLSVGCSVREERIVHPSKYDFPINKYFFFKYIFMHVKSRKETSFQQPGLGQIQERGIKSSSPKWVSGTQPEPSSAVSRDEEGIPTEIQVL